MDRKEQIKQLEKEWKSNPRWTNVKRGYTAEDVVRLRGSFVPECSIAKRGAEKLWSLVNGSAKKGYVNSLGALTGGQAMQQVKAGIEAIYLSGTGRYKSLVDRKCKYAIKYIKEVTKGFYRHICK